MIANLWMAFDDRAQSTAKEQDEFGQFGAGYNALGDPITPSIFRTDDAPGPRTYELWSLYFEAADDDAVVQARNDLNAIYPGQLRTSGAFWYDDGRQVGTENVYDTRIVTKTWSALNPDYQPDPELPDFDDRYTIQVTGDVEETYVSGHTGDPLLPIHPRTIECIPDIVDEDGVFVSRPTSLSDVNLGAGQAPRNFL